MTWRDEPEILTQEWREMHVSAGDQALQEVAGLVEGGTGIDHPGIAILVAMAQAHYTAANVRAKPASR